MKQRIRKNKRGTWKVFLVLIGHIKLGIGSKEEDDPLGGFDISNELYFKDSSGCSGNHKLNRD